MMLTTHDLAPFFEVLRARRSVRAFRTRPVDKEQLEKILRAANSAPSAGNLQAYEIVVIRDQGMKEALITATYNDALFSKLPSCCCSARTRPAPSPNTASKTDGNFHSRTPRSPVPMPNWPRLRSA